MESVERLTGYPRHALIGHELCRCRVPELDLLVKLGSPTEQTAPFDSEPVFFWDLRWACGLVASLAFHQLTDELTIHLDAPELDHALRHLGIDPSDVWLWQYAEPEAFAAAIPDPPDRNWSVWKQAESDGGRQMCLASAITERDARCWTAELDGAPGGARHWAERLRTFSDAPALPSRDAGPSVP